MSAWVEHCKEYSKKHGCTYKEAMIRARPSYVPNKPVKPKTKKVVQQPVPTKIEEKPIAKKSTKKKQPSQPVESDSEGSPVEMVTPKSKRKGRADKKSIVE